ncbi:MAG: SPOR domain-containing protein [Bacteroidota bacterium]|nr:SPOR domain-containing protein [Bacteroidota bacterium]
MRHLQHLILSILISTASILNGCSSSEEATEDRETPPTGGTNVLQKVDTLKVDIQNTQKPNYQSKTSSSDLKRPRGMYSVQIGAHKMPDNADRIAAIAKERYNINVYTIHDKNDNLYKVMIGDFNTKEEARNFRDEIVRQFPDDYKDAWVSENK